MKIEIKIAHDGHSRWSTWLYIDGVGLGTLTIGDRNEASAKASAALQAQAFHDPYTVARRIKDEIARANDQAARAKQDLADAEERLCELKSLIHP